MFCYDTVILNTILLMSVYLTLTSHLDFNVFTNFVSLDIANLFRISGILSVKQGSLLIFVTICYILISSNVTSILQYNLNKYYGRIIFTYILLTSNIYLVNINLLEKSSYNNILVDINIILHPLCTYISIIYWIVWIYKYVNYYQHRIEIITINLVKPYLISTLGLLLGATWAYTQLGWATYWFWDNIEIISLIIWLCYVYKFHYKNNVILNGIIATLCVLIVRLGILESIHTFSIDNSITYLIILLEMVIIYLGINNKLNVSYCQIMVIWLSIFISIQPSIYSILVLIYVIYNWVRLPIHETFIIIYILLMLNEYYANNIIITHDLISSQYQDIKIIDENIAMIKNTMMKWYSTRADIVTNLIQDKIVVKSGNVITITENYYISIVTMVIILYVLKSVSSIRVRIYR